MCAEMSLVVLGTLKGAVASATGQLGLRGAGSRSHREAINGQGMPFV